MAAATSSTDRTLALPERPVVTWLRMVRVVNRTQRAAADQFSAWGLSAAQFDVLAQLGASQGPSQMELATRLLVTQGNVCQLLDGMEKKGLVERRREGRTNHIFLTPAGRELAIDVVPEHETWQAERMAALDDEEQRQLARLLRKLDRAQVEAEVAATA
ncbi:MAG TPA: MarR family transcriptional regulator [Trueperaceae bacterium]|nr:MarR family transcriptional regulator [Trueperaceae bacterium]